MILHAIKENKHLNLQLNQALNDYEELIIKYDKKVMKLEQENKQLKESLDFLWEKFKKVNTANRKAKEYIKECEYHLVIQPQKLLEILGDKE